MPTSNEYIGELFVICREQRDRIAQLEQENRVLVEALKAKEAPDGAAVNGAGTGGGVDGVRLRQRAKRVATPSTGG